MSIVYGRRRIGKERKIELFARRVIETLEPVLNLPYSQFQSQGLSAYLDNLLARCRILF